MTTIESGPEARPAPVDMAHHAHLSGVFAPQREEVDVRNLQVVGELPRELNGAYLRNGPNPRFDPIGSYTYPLDGDGMIHRIEITDGTARYTNQFVRTPMVLAEEKAGHAIWAGILDPYVPAADEVGPQLAGSTRALPDINIVRHGGRLLAMSEGERPYRINPDDLTTIGVETCGGAMAVGSTAHPKLDPETGELVLFNYLLESPFLTWSVIAADGKVTREPTVVEGVDVPLMIHDMALTKRFIVLFLCPLAFDMAAAMQGGSLLQWRPEDGTRIALIPRDGSRVRWASADAFWVWHFANAFDEPDGTVTVDYAQWENPGFFTKDTRNTGSLVRAHIDPSRGTVNRTTISETVVEFPRVDDRRTAHEHHSIATVGKLGENWDSMWFFDIGRGAESHWEPGSVAVGEPIFIPGHDNYWGTIGTDRNDMSSWFFLLHEDDPGAGPFCGIRLPIRVPAGLHGNWMPM